MALPAVPKPSIESILTKLKEDVRALQAKVSQSPRATATKLIDLGDVIWKVAHPTQAARDHSVPRWDKSKRVFRSGGGLVLTKFYTSTDEDIAPTHLLTEDDGVWPEDQAWAVAATATILPPDGFSFELVFQEGNAGFDIGVAAKSAKLAGGPFAVKIDGVDATLEFADPDDVVEITFEDGTLPATIPLGNPGLGRLIAPLQADLILFEDVDGVPTLNSHSDYAATQWNPITDGLTVSTSWLYENGSIPMIFCGLLLPSEDQAPGGYTINVVVHMWPVP